MIYLVAHNKSHVEVLYGAYEALRARKVATTWAAADGFVPPAREELSQRGIAALTLDQLKNAPRPGDVVVVCNDWLPAPLAEMIERFQASGIVTAAAVEGCRFTLSNKYTRVGHLLGWGPSARSLPPTRIHIVGSPVLEHAASRRRDPNSRGTLINYRFKARTGDGLLWLEPIAQACAEANSPFTISIHPASAGVDPRYNVSFEPVEDLLLRCSMLVSRPSTVVYQALMLGIPTIVFPTGGEELGEFAEPMGAYPIAKNAKEVENLIKDYSHHKLAYDGTTFLKHHVDIDIAQSASKRIADVLLGLSK